MPVSKEIPRKKPVTLSLGTGKRWKALRTGTLSCVLLAVQMMIVLSPVLAQPAPNSTGAGGSAARGVLIYWPYHALLMSTGMILLVADSLSHDSIGKDRGTKLTCSLKPQEAHY